MLEDIYEKGKEKLKTLGLYDYCERGVETGYVNVHNKEIFKKFHLVMEGIDAEFSETSTSVFDVLLNSPLMMASITSPIPAITDDALIKIAKAMGEVESMVWLGYPISDNLEEIAKIAPVGQMIKPFKKRERIFEAVKYVEDSGATAFGVDFDSGARTKFGGKLRGPEAEPLSSEEIKKITDSSELPFLLKGILSVKDARKAMEIGVENIVITNHGAHTLDYLPHPLEVLPEIMENIKEDCKVFVDSGFRRGSDVFKGIAMGANIVMVGRPILYGLAAKGEEGVKEVVDTITKELQRIMTMCGAKNVAEIDETMISECEY